MNVIIMNQLSEMRKDIRFCEIIYDAVFSFDRQAQGI